MNNDKLEKLLNNSRLKNVENRKHKEKLRRELLNSKYFKKKSGIKAFRSKELILGFAATVILVIIFSTNLFRQNDSELDSIMSGLKTNYAGFLHPGTAANYNSQLELFDTQNNSIPFNVKQLIDFSSNKYHSIVSDPITNESLYEIMIIGDDRYLMKNPQIRFLNTEVNHKGKMIFMKKEDTVDMRDSITVTIHEPEDLPVDDWIHSAYLSIERSILTHSEMKLNYKPQTIHQVNRETNFTEYITTNPYDIYTTLVNSDSLHFIGKVELEGENKEYSLIRFNRRMTLTEVKTILIKIDKDSLKSTEMFSKILDGDSNYLNWVLSKNDTQNFSSSKLSFDLPEKVITVYISSDFDISKCKYSVKRKQSVVDLATITFNKHSLVPLSQHDFNPAEHNLVKSQPGS